MKISIYLFVIASILKQIRADETDRRTEIQEKPINKMIFWQYLDILNVVSSKYEQHADLLKRASKCLELTDIETSLDSLNLILLALWFSPRNQTIYLKIVQESEREIRTLDAEMYYKITKFVTLASNMAPNGYDDVSTNVELWKSYFKNFTPQITDPIPFFPSFLSHPALIDEQKAAIACYETVLGVQSNQRFYKLYYQAVSTIKKKISASKKASKKELDIALQDILKSIQSINIVDTRNEHEMDNFEADLRKRTEIERATTQNGWIKSVGIATVSITAALIAAKGLLAVLRGC